MNEHNCNGCLFSDICQEEQACEHFVPTDSDADEEYIERERQEFFKDWFRYTSESDD